MRKLKNNDVRKFVNNNIVTFHEARTKILTELNLKKIIKKKNPYLFKAKNITVASDFIKTILDAFLSSSEEKLFGDFLEELAIFISTKTCDGKKSSATGIDLEFDNKNIHYLVSIKSGPNWGNNSQQRKQEEDRNASKIVFIKSEATVMFLYITSYITAHNLRKESFGFIQAINC